MNFKVFLESVEELLRSFYNDDQYRINLLGDWLEEEGLKNKNLLQARDIIENIVQNVNTEFDGNKINNLLQKLKHIVNIGYHENYLIEKIVEAHIKKLVADKIDNLNVMQHKNLLGQYYSNELSERVSYLQRALRDDIDRFIISGRLVALQRIVDDLMTDFPQMPIWQKLDNILLNFYRLRLMI